jgi:4-amino-4-deoxy-L-arabinose transferase-like glycosyltransferase
MIRSRMRTRDLAKSLIGSSAFVFVATLVLHRIPFPTPEPIMSGDGLLYAALADGILEGDWRGVLDSSRVLWTKATFLAIVAGAKAIAPAGWPSLIVAMNVVLSATTATLIVGFVRRATGSAAASWAAFLFHAGSFDVVFWTRYIMADSLFAFLGTLVFVLVALPILEGRRARSMLPLAAGLLLATLTRPPGALLVFVVLLGILAFWPRPDGRELPPGRQRWLWLAVGVVMAGGVALRTFVVHDPQRWPTDFVRPKVEEFAMREKIEGEVVTGQVSTFREPPATYSDHLILEADRFGRFFQFVSVDFSRMHNLVNASSFVPLYALGILGIVDGLRTTDRKRRNLVILLLLWVLLYAWFHALTVLLWRYRVPLMPQLIILAAFGVDSLRAMMASRRAGTIESSR